MRSQSHFQDYLRYIEVFLNPSRPNPEWRKKIKLNFILAELFSICLKESCFPDFWKVSLVVSAFKNVGKRSTAKNYCPVSFLSVVSKVFEKLVNNRIVDHLEKYGLFSDFQYGFRSFFINCRSSDSSVW